MRLQETVALTLSEKDLQRQVVSAAKMLGWMVYHTHDSRRSQAGFPDLVMVREHPYPLVSPQEAHTEAVAIELKSEKGKVSAEQEAWLDLLRRLPGVKFAGVVRPSDWYQGVLDEVLR